MDYKKNTKKYFDLICEEMNKHNSKPLNSGESKLLDNAFKSKIYGLNVPREAKIQHTPKALFTANTLFRPLSEIMTTIEIIELIPTLICNFPFQRHGISKTRYLQYHVGNYFVEIGKLRDALIGYLGKIKNGYRNSQEKQDVDTLTKKLKKYITASFDNIKNIRDEHVHKFRYTNKDIDRISLLELLCKYPNPQEQKNITLAQLYQKSYKETRKYWANFIKEEVSTIETILDHYFKQLIKLVSIKGKIRYPKKL